MEMIIRRFAVPGQLPGSRQVAMYLSKQLTTRSLRRKSAAKFGNRDHTTVMHACVADQ